MKDVDTEGIDFASPLEKDLFVRGQREAAIAGRSEHPVVANEARGKAREYLFKAAKARQRAVEGRKPR